jgi:hypothetical protein
MKFLGKDIKEVNKGYFGVRRCTICNEHLRDVDLIEIHCTNYFCFIPLRSTIIKRILVCTNCKAYMEIDDKLWKYYSTYYNHRFDKQTTDGIINTLSSISNTMAENGIALKVDDETSQKSLDLIFNSLCDKYGVSENVEEIVSVFFK